MSTNPVKRNIQHYAGSVVSSIVAASPTIVWGQDPTDNGLFYLNLQPGFNHSLWVPFHRIAGIPQPIYAAAAYHDTATKTDVLFYIDKDREALQRVAVRVEDGSPDGDHVQTVSEVFFFLDKI